MGGIEATGAIEGRVIELIPSNSDLGVRDIQTFAERVRDAYERAGRISPVQADLQRIVIGVACEIGHVNGAIAIIWSQELREQSIRSGQGVGTGCDERWVLVGRQELRPKRNVVDIHILSQMVG